VTGDATRAADLEAAFRDAEAAISTLGWKAPLIADSTAAVIAAARATGLKQVTVMSSFAVQRDRLTAPMKAMSGAMMGSVVASKAAGEEKLRASELDWTIVYATMLTNGPQAGTAYVPPAAVKIGTRTRSPAATSRAGCST
jgi:uncharacterized protein YbjT (DUF2867 family)